MTIEDLLTRLEARIGKDPTDTSLRVAYRVTKELVEEWVEENKDSEEVPIGVSSMVTSRNHVPAVHLTVGPGSAKMAVPDALRVAGDIQSAAHAATVDAFLVGFLQQECGTGLANGAAVRFAPAPVSGPVGSAL
jgi:hypothetical protein